MIEWGGGGGGGLAAPAFVGEWGGELREAGWKHE